MRSILRHGDIELDVECLIKYNKTQLNVSNHVMSLFGNLEKCTNWQKSSLASHDSRGFQISPNGPEFERKWYG